MLRLYEDWQNSRTQFRKNDIFQLTGPYEITEIDGQPTAVFNFATVSSIPIMLPVNQTSLDILETLQTPHTLGEIVNMLEEKYNTSGHSVANIVEEYLISLIHDGVCEQRKEGSNVEAL